MYKWSIVLLLVLVSNARAQGLPSEVDLRAAYCIPIVQETLSETSLFMRDYAPLLPEGKEQGKELFEKKLSETATNLRRLQLYLLPRPPYLDPYGVVAAKKSGDEDNVRMKELAKTCDAKCQNAFNRVSALSCVMKCHSDSPIRSRISVCQDLSWLPF